MPFCHTFVIGSISVGGAGRLGYSLAMPMNPTHACCKRSIDKMCDVDNARGIFFRWRNAAIKNECHYFVFSFNLVFSPMRLINKKIIRFSKMQFFDNIYAS